MRITLLLLLLVASNVSAQDYNVHQSTTVPPSARFEVVQSPLLARLAFKLDRFTGDTWQFVEARGGGYAWQKILRIDVPNNTTRDGSVNYQIFLSSARAQMTILINTNTGVSWYIAEDPEEGVFWRPMD